MEENEQWKWNSTHAGYWNNYNWCTDYLIGPVVWSVLGVICFLLGCPASLLVLDELIQRQRQRSCSDIFMLVLSVLDLTFTVQIPFSIGNFMIWKIMELDVYLDFFYSLNFFGRPLLMACVCWDCYVAVLYPIIYKTNTKLMLVKKIITVIISFITVAFSLALCMKAWVVTTPLMGIPLMLALPIITFCDISVLRALRKPDPTGNIKIHPQKRQALHTIVTSFIMTFTVYLTPVVIFSFGYLIKLTTIKLYCCVYFPAFCFSMCGCVIMPVLYLVTVGKLDTLKNCWKK